MGFVFFYDNKGNSETYEVKSQTVGNLTEYNFSGFGVSTQGFIADLEVNPFKINIEDLKNGAKWKDLGSGRISNSTLHEFKDSHGVEWKVEIRESDDKKKHSVELTDSSGNKQYIVTYDNLAAWIIAAIIIGVVCLLGIAISAAIINCKDQCGDGNVAKLKVTITAMDSFPWAPYCTYECICKE